MTKELFLALVRHGLTTVGGVAATLGLIPEAEVEPLYGAVLILAGFGWSFWRKVANKPRAS